MKRKKCILPIGSLLVLLMSGCCAAVTVPETGVGETEVIQEKAGEERESGPASLERKVEVCEGKKAEGGVKAGISLPFAEGVWEGLMPEIVAPKEAPQSETETPEKEKPVDKGERGISTKENPKSVPSVSSKKNASQTTRPSMEETSKPAETMAAEALHPESSAPAASGTTLPVPEETSAPAEALVPTETVSETRPAAEETVSVPPETTAAMEETVPKGPYDYAFDIGMIQADGVSIGRSMGYAWDASLTPGNASWWNPVTASLNNQGAALRQSLENYIRFHTAEHLASYGMEPITAFHIYYEPRGNGEYLIYFLFV